MSICSCLSLLGGYGWMVSTLQWPLDLRATDSARPLFLLICPQLCVALKHRAQVSEQTFISLQSNWKVCNATAAMSGTASCMQTRLLFPAHTLAQYYSGKLIFFAFDDKTSNQVQTNDARTGVFLVAEWSSHRFLSGVIPGAVHHMQFSNMWPWSTKPVISSTGIFVTIANNTLYGSKW